MSDRPSAIAFGIDADSLMTLSQALPGWAVEALAGPARTILLSRRTFGSVSLLVVGGEYPEHRPVALCRTLCTHAELRQTPLVLLVRPNQPELVRAALEAGAHACLILPIRIQDVMSMLNRALAGNQPGQHTLDLQRPQQDSPWQDDGGES